MKAAIGSSGVGLALCLGLVACGPAPAPKPAVTAATAQVEAGELIVDTLTGGAFRGRAGAAWTEAEIAAQVAKMECAGRKPASFAVTPAASGFTFSGSC